MKDTAHYIPNIDVGKVYDQRYEGLDIHCEVFSKLADFFGRNMPVHWHDCYFQIHYLHQGQLHLQLEQTHYVAQGPLFVFTPPTVPHAFISTENADGYVLTIEQSLVWPMLHRLFPRQEDARIAPAMCVELQKDSNQLESLWHWLNAELKGKALGHESAASALVELLLIQLLRHTGDSPSAHQGVQGDIRSFQNFNQLIQAHATKHWTLKEYAHQLHMTASRLNDLCNRISGCTPKQMITAFLLRESKRMLIYTSWSVQEIAYQLGFKDPSYFSRFFIREMCVSPSDYRLDQPTPETMKSTCV